MTSPSIVSAARDLLGALQKFGFPVSDAATRALVDGGSLEAQAVHVAAVGLKAALAGGAIDREAVLEEAAKVAEREAEAQALTHKAAVELADPARRLGKRIAAAIRALSQSSGG